MSLLETSSLLLGSGKTAEAAEAVGTVQLAGVYPNPECATLVYIYVSKQWA